MKYRSQMKPKAEKDLKAVTPHDLSRVVERLRRLENDLSGDVKRLTDHVPEFRMRAGDWRSLFEIEKEGKKEFVVLPLRGVHRASRST